MCVFSGPKTKMTEKIPAGEVYKGMAWAYLLNYLPLALLGTTAEGRSKYRRISTTPQLGEVCKGLARPGPIPIPISHSPSVVKRVLTIEKVLNDIGDNCNKSYAQGTGP